GSLILLLGCPIDGKALVFSGEAVPMLGDRVAGRREVCALIRPRGQQEALGLGFHTARGRRPVRCLLASRADARRVRFGRGVSCPVAEELLGQALGPFGGDHAARTLGEVHATPTFLFVHFGASCGVPAPVRRLVPHIRFINVLMYMYSSTLCVPTVPSVLS